MKTFVKYWDGGFRITDSEEWIAKVIEGQCPWHEDHEALNTPRLHDSRLRIHEADPRWAVCSLGCLFQVVTE